MINHKIETFYIHHVNTLFSQKYEIKKFLLEHPRRHKMFENLTHEIKMCALTRNIHLNDERLKDLVKDFTQIFAKAALATKEKEIKAKDKSITSKEHFNGDSFEGHIDV